MKVTAAEVARVCAGHVIGDPTAVASSASIDSRTIAAGQLFAALRGEFLDGHDYLRSAFAAGASIALVEELDHSAGGTQVVVGDVALSLAQLAAWVRAGIGPLVVGITGSTGKTSTKDFLRHVAQRKLSTVASAASFNNDLGVPLTLLSAKTETEVVICEMGSRGPGHIRRLCEIAEPQIGIVTNVGVSHYEFFGSKDAIADAKAELIEALEEGHAAILNADDPLVMSMSARTKADVTTFGFDPGATIRGEAVRIDRLGRATFRMAMDGEAAWVSLPVSGEHQVYNALAAAAGGVALGLSLEECKAGLEDSRLSPWRMEVSEIEGVIFVNDAYNANPASVAAALDSSAKMSSGGRLIAVLGHMAELGEIEANEHRRVGALAASLASKLIVVGKKAGGVAEGAREAGLGAVSLVETASDVRSVIGPLRPGDVVLVKGSRVAGLEKVVADLAEMVGTG